MKKRFLATIMALTMAFSLAACSSGATNTDSDGTKLKVGMVTDIGGVNDGSFNQSAWEGLQRAETELGVDVKYLESKADSDYAPNIDTLIDEGYDLIICIGYMLAPDMRIAAEANPDQKFAIVDDSTCADLDNVSCLMFEQSQASYLVGYVAGLTTETDTIGFVLGMSTGIMNEFGYGYVAGAIDSNPNITVLQNDVNSFGDTAAGKTAANTMIANGADVIYHAAGGSGLGAIDACKEAGIWAIGVDSDQSSYAPENILTSAMKRVDNACFDVIEEVVNGNFASGVKTYSLTDGGVDIAPTTDNIDPDILTTVNEVKDKIISGEITVPKTQAEFEATYGTVYELD